MQKTLAVLNIDALNEMQVAALDAIAKYPEVILLANTGSGKTLAFLLPLLKLLDPINRETQALIIVPSRELALQIEQVFKSMRTSFKVTCCYGGHKREIEENNLLQPPALLIGTPGRLADHIRRGSITVDAIVTVVLDEFDKSLELGFQEEMSFIMGSIMSVKKKILTSATDAMSIPEFLQLNAPYRLSFLDIGEKSADRLTVKTVESADMDKTSTLFRLICFLGNRSTIVFCNQREYVDKTAAYLTQKGIVTTFYHGALEQPERDVALAKFRNGSVNVLVTTDLAARGLDIPNIRFIIHFQLPQSEDAFTHRNGRTARIEASGTAILILNQDEYLPTYIHGDIEQIQLPEETIVPSKPVWTTLFVGAGKKDKVNKVDIVGFLSNKGNLKQEDIGLIEVKDYFAFVAIRKSKVNQVLQDIKEERIKNKKVKIDVAR